MENELKSIVLSIAAEVSREPLWSQLADYYDLRGRGLRDGATQAAQKFAQAAGGWSFEERRRFCLWFVTRTWPGELSGKSAFSPRYKKGDTGIFTPRAVSEVVLLPTFAEWARQEAGNPEPHFWLALYDESPWRHLAEALRLVPEYGPACATRIKLTLAAIEYNQHELPFGYLDDPEDDLARLRDLEPMMFSVSNASDRIVVERRISVCQAKAEDWIAMRDELKAMDWSDRMSIWQQRQR